MKKEIRRNIITYTVFLCIAGIGIYYGQAVELHHPSLRVWEITNLLIVRSGLPFLFFQQKAGLPDFWQNDIAQKDRILYPVLIGMVFGLLDILVFQVMLYPEPYTELPPFLQPFPYSVFLYFSGALEVEVFYRLIPLTLLLLWGSRFQAGKYYTVIFWIGAILTALREPLEQLPDGNLTLTMYSLITGFLMNFLQAIWYKRSGFLASLFIRLGHYLLWHISLGIYVENSIG
jgi:hypothetical protein